METHENYTKTTIIRQPPLQVALTTSGTSSIHCQLSTDCRLFIYSL